MDYGFVKVAAGTPKTRVADVRYNIKMICALINEAAEKGAKILALPELCITGYTCGDLFAQDLLQAKAKEALGRIIEYTTSKEILVFVGLPLAVEGKLYNVAAALKSGEVLGFVTKTHLLNHGEFNELRQFTAGPTKATEIIYQEKKIPFGPSLLFNLFDQDDLIVSAEIGTDVSAPIPPSVTAAFAGATVIVNCSAINESIGRSKYLRETIQNLSARLHVGYVWANAGIGESTTDLVFGGGNLLVENGEVLVAAEKYRDGIIYHDFNHQSKPSVAKDHVGGGLNLLNSVSGQTSLKLVAEPLDGYESQTQENATEKIRKSPFVPECSQERAERFEEILTLQAMGLVKRFTHTKADTAVIGISGGLDSTLALLVIVRAFEVLGKDKEDIVAVSMPCFGTTRRTYENALAMAKKLGVTLREISIEKAVLQHFADIGHDINEHNATYENAQARERTQVLMDIANQTNGIVIGTGDMSELALGWATYNGDHMSMYGVNASVPKTLIAHLIAHVATGIKDQELKQVLQDVVETPISPELLPSRDGDISQKTEDLVGPYELHDFFLYHTLRHHAGPSKIYTLAGQAFTNEYDKKTILKWLEVFYKRFFAQQFKRSCMPDGPSIGSISLSPRAGFRMPSDACAALWLEELDSLKQN